MFLRGVHVPVMYDTARRACPHADMERLGAAADPARRAHLAGGLPPADPAEVAAVLAGLVFQHRCERRPAGVMHRLGRPGPAEPGHAQVLHVHRLGLADETSGFLVRPVPAGISHPGMDPRGLDPGLSPVTAALLLTGQGFLRLAELALSAAQEPGVRDLPAVGQDREMGQPQVDPGLGADPGKRVVPGSRDGTREVASMITVTLDGSGGRSRDHRTGTSPIFGR